MASRSSSDDRARAALVLLLALLGACATVRPEEREILADPAMRFGARSGADALDGHVLSNREGSIGGSGGTAGGCGCN